MMMVNINISIQRLQVTTIDSITFISTVSLIFSNIILPLFVNTEIEVSLNTSEIKVQENAGEVAICVMITHPSFNTTIERFIQVAVFTVNGSAGMKI